ncbi:transcription elongation factor SPT6 [Mycena polygramma]|nr:transcription elongation factor SPT6 [Mycena polygramma]
MNRTLVGTPPGVAPFKRRPSFAAPPRNWRRRRTTRSRSRKRSESDKRHLAEISDLRRMLLEKNDAEFLKEQRGDEKEKRVFEPSQIRALYLTEDDELIRAQDIPKRMQLSSSIFSDSTVLAPIISFGPEDLDDAATFSNGLHHALRNQLAAVVSFVSRHLFIENEEVPYIWHHKLDHISHFDASKYRSLLEWRRALNQSYTRLNEIIVSVDVVADTSEWLTMKYKDKKQEDSQFRFHDDEEPQETTAKRKMPSRISAYEVAKKSVIAILAQQQLAQQKQGFGLEAHEVALNFLANERVHFVQDQELNPMVYAEQFASPDHSMALPPDELLRRARMIMATEHGKDPLLRDHMRRLFRDEARVSVEPTEHGVSKIHEHDLYFGFKYLHQKPVREMLEGSQSLFMLEAEAKNLITITISLPSDVKATFERRLTDALASDSFSEAAKSWNEQGNLVVQEVLDQHLLPLGAKWAREYIREEVEDVLATRCGTALRKRIDVAPFTVPDMKEDKPSVLAVSWGKGDPHKDAITLVFLDSRGRMREQTKLDNLVDVEMRDEFIDLLRRRKSDVIGIEGFTMATTNCMRSDNASAETDQVYNTPVIYVRDDIAQLFQRSQRANEGFSTRSLITNTAPLNEAAPLGPDIVALLLEAVQQTLVPKEIFRLACERAIIDVVNKVGVAVGDPYYQTLLPFVCGLGPRKAQNLVKMIERQGENIGNREQFIKAGLLTKTLFINAAGFLRISPQVDLKPAKLRADDDHAPDPLDDTRIHPEDYELARKMAMDALEYDEEDVQDRHPSWNDKKLSELNLDEFAVSLYEANDDLNRHTLNVIRDELSHPFAEQNHPYQLSDGWDVLTMLSGETQRSLDVGLIITVVVLRAKPQFVNVKLESGIEGVINAEHLFDSANRNRVLTKGQAVSALVLHVKRIIEQDSFFAELSVRSADMHEGDRHLRDILADNYWDKPRFLKDQEMLQRKKRAEVDRSRRVIRHSNFHNFNTAQAEPYLDKQQRGDVVIRHSSKGSDHLAVTWKVDDQLYQHIGQLRLQFLINPLDVTEPNADPTGHCSTLNRKRPGRSSLCFLANKNSTVQTWPVHVTPEAYHLFDAAALGVPELCDAFKSGGKTPFGAGTGTPAPERCTAPTPVSVLGQKRRAPDDFEDVFRTYK